VLDTPALKDAAFGVEDAKNTVSLMEVDSDRNWIVVRWSWFGHKTTYPTTLILYPSRARSARRTKQNQAFMSADPFFEEVISILTSRGFEKAPAATRKRHQVYISGFFMNYLR
jgi:hypothetical protein